MLIDNVMELALHNVAQEKSAEQTAWGRYAQEPIDSKALQSALGQSFDAKARFASSAKLISTETCESILNLHGFRNTAYHKGLRHEGILHAITTFYLIVTCDVLKASTTGSWWASSDDRYSLRAMKYLGPCGHFDYESRFRAAFERIRDVGVSLQGNLIRDLAVDLETEINLTDEYIEFLATDAPEPETRDEVIITSQTWAFAFTDEAKQFAQEKGFSGKCFWDLIEWLRIHYPWKTKRDPIPGWRKRLSSLRSEKNKHLALKKYCDFLKQTEPLRQVIDRAAESLDRHIQEEIDRGRGK